MTVPVSEVEAIVEAPPGGHGRPEGVIQGRSPGQIAWLRVKRDKVTLVAIGVVIVFVLLAIAAPFLKAFKVIDPSTPHTDLVQGPASTPIGPVSGASSAHWLGVVPGSGQDILSRVVYGLTFDMSIALAATIVTVVIGVIMGLIAGFYGRWVDYSLGRLMDLILAFPFLLMVLALTPLFIGQPPSNKQVVLYLILVLGIFGWPYFARIIRGEVLSLREREYIEAARSLGASTRRILWKELLPNLRGPILVYATIILPTYVSAEAALAYLGVSLQPPFPTLGTVLNDAVPWTAIDPAYLLIPGITLVLVVLSFNLLGDGLGDALNPKSDRMT